jgi:hypothetical protein
VDRSVGAHFRALLCLAATPVGITTLVPTDARATPMAGAATVLTTNKYEGGNSIWVTIYDLGKTQHMDWGCVYAGEFRKWQSGTYIYGSFYYVRAEVKAGRECAGATICDTTVQINPQSQLDSPGGLDWKKFTGTAVTLLQNGKNCYWRHDN